MSTKATWGFGVGLAIACASAWPAGALAQSEAPDAAPTRFRASLDVGKLEVWVRPAEGEEQTCVAPCTLTLAPGAEYELSASLADADRGRSRAGSFVAGESTELTLEYRDRSRIRHIGTLLMQVGLTVGVLGGGAALAAGMLMGNQTVQVASLLAGAAFLLVGVVGSLLRSKRDGLRLVTAPDGSRPSIVRYE